MHTVEKKHDSGKTSARQTKLNVKTTKELLEKQQAKAQVKEDIAAEKERDSQRCTHCAQCGRLEKDDEKFKMCARCRESELRTTLYCSRYVIISTAEHDILLTSLT